MPFLQFVKQQAWRRDREGSRRGPEDQQDTAKAGVSVLKKL